MRIQTFLSSLAVFLAISYTQAYSVTWSPPQAIVSGSSAIHNYPSITVDTDGKWHLVYDSSFYDGSVMTCYINYMNSDGDSHIISQVSPAGYISDPDIAAGPDGSLHVVYRHVNNAGQVFIMYTNTGTDILSEFLWQRIVLDESYANYHGHDWDGTYEVRIQAGHVPDEPECQIYPSVKSTGNPDPQRILVKDRHGETVDNEELLRIILSYAHNAALYRNWAMSDEYKPTILDVPVDCQVFEGEDFGYDYPGELWFPVEFDPDVMGFRWFFLDQPIDFPPLFQAGLRHNSARQRCYYSIMKHCFLESGIRSPSDEAAIEVYTALKTPVDGVEQIQEVVDIVSKIDRLAAGGKYLPEAIRLVLKEVPLKYEVFQWLIDKLHSPNNYLGLGKKLAKGLDVVFFVLKPGIAITGDVCTAMALAGAAEGQAAHVGEALQLITDNGHADLMLREAISEAKNDLMNGPKDLASAVAAAIDNYTHSTDFVVDVGEFAVSCASAGWGLAIVLWEDTMQMVGAFQEISLDATWNNVFFTDPLRELASDELVQAINSPEVDSEVIDKLNALSSFNIYQQYFYARGLLEGQSLLYQFGLWVKEFLSPHYQQRKPRLNWIREESRRTYWGRGMMFPYISGRQEINGEFVGFVPKKRLDYLVGLATVGSSQREGTKITIAVFSPVDLLVTDPLGRSVGPILTGEQSASSTLILNQIPAASYSGPEAEPEIITVEQPLPGTYDILLTGSDVGPFTFVVTAEEDGNTISEYTTTGLIGYGMTLNAMVDVNLSGENFIVESSEPHREDGWITGIVLNWLTGEPVAGASVELTEFGEAAISDANGLFDFGDISSGNYFIKATAPDFYASESVAVHVEPNEATEHEIVLKPSVLKDDLVQLDIQPDSFNLSSQGQMVSACIQLPHPYSVENIVVSTLALAGEVFAERRPMEVGDDDNDGLSDLKVKFDRQRVAEVLAAVGGSADIELTISGYLYDGTRIEGSDTIKVFDPKKEK